MKLEMEAAIDAWLGESVFFGESLFKDKEDVKTLILKPHNRRFDKDRKVWGTTSLWDARRLVNAGIWTPLGVDRAWMPALANKLEMRIGAAEKEMQATAAVVSERKRTESTPIASGPTREQREKLFMDRERGIRECGEDERRLCEQQGIPREVVTASLKRDSVSGLELGPRAGLSASERVLRLVRLQQNSARVLGQDPQKRTRELVAALLSADWNFKEEVKKRAARRAKREPAPGGAVRQETRPRAAPRTGPATLARGECGKCMRPVSVQFLCCWCFGKPWSESWVHCRKCDLVVNPLLRGCAHFGKSAGETAHL